MTYTPREAEVEAQRLLDVQNFCKYPYINGDEEDFAASTIINIAENEIFSAVVDANFDEWCLVPRWTIDQATALFFGKDPEVFLWSPLRKFVGMHRRIRKCSLMRKRLKSERFGDVVAIDFEAILIWARDNDFRFPEELYSLSKSERVEEKKSKGEDDFLDSLESREKNTLKKLLIVMAVEGFGYNPITQRCKSLDRLDKTAREILNQSLSPEAARSMLMKLSSRVELSKQGVEGVLRSRQGKQPVVGTTTSAKPIRQGPPEKTG